MRRPAGWYDHVLATEAEPYAQLPAPERTMLERNRSLGEGLARSAGHEIHATGLWKSAVLSQVPLLAEDLERGGHLYPAGRLDADLQQVDLRDFNSWRMTLADVPTAELLEVHLVNAVAPFVLNARLKPLVAAVPTHDAHVVNVSAMEGQFYRRFKTDKHPHTNMAKAALNMLTRTAAADYVRGVRSYAGLPLDKLAGLIRGAKLFVGTDSGPYQLSEWLQTPSIGLFGPAPPEITGSRRATDRTLYHRLDCSPCDQRRCVRPDNPCMHRIAVPEVAAHVWQMLTPNG